MYKIVTVTNKNYIEPTYVCLKSFYEFNSLKVTVFITDSTILDKRFDEFNIDVEYLKLDLFYNGYYSKSINEISAKIKIHDLLDTDYILFFDTDSLFCGNIEDILIDYKEEFIGVQETIPKGYRITPYINVGFIILKKSNVLYNKYIEFLKTSTVDWVEQEFLNLHFKSKKLLSEKYNIRVGYSKINDPVFLHFSTQYKPFDFNPTAYLSLLKCKTSKWYFKYFDYINTLNISKEFKLKCNYALKYINSLKQFEEHL